MIHRERFSSFVQSYPCSTLEQNLTPTPAPKCKGEKKRKGSTVVPDPFSLFSKIRQPREAAELRPNKIVRWRRLEKKKKKRWRTPPTLYSFEGTRNGAFMARLFPQTSPAQKGGKRKGMTAYRSSSLCPGPCPVQLDREKTEAATQLVFYCAAAMEEKREIEKTGTNLSDSFRGAGLRQSRTPLPITKPSLYSQGEKRESHGHRSSKYL